MKTLNNYKIIGIDHGYGNIKTANCCFPTGVIASDTEPPFANDLLIWNNKYYSIGMGTRNLRRTSSLMRITISLLLPLLPESLTVSVSPMQRYLLPPDFRLLG